MKKRRGSHYISKILFNIWLDKYSVDQIKEAMNKSRGYWDEIKKILGGKNG